jgi:hypothetical protein
MTRRRCQALVILALTPVVLALDPLAWLAWAAWHLMPWLLAAAAVIAAYRVGRHRPLPPPQPPKVIQGRADEGGGAL